MSDWNIERIRQLIDDGVEESLSLEYKGGGALSKNDEVIREITRDVSAFANSSGGTIIYGVAEFSDKAKEHLPERIDPIDRLHFTKRMARTNCSNHSAQDRVGHSSCER